MKYTLNKLVAEEIGMHVGDGSMNIYKGVYCYTIACHHIDDKEFMDQHVIPMYKKIYGVKIYPRLWSKGTYGFRIHNKEVVKFKQSIGLPLGKKTNITIPLSIIKNELLLKAFLRGFFATDGSINTFIANKKTVYPRIEMCNVSQQLMQQIQEALLHFGFHISMREINKNNPKWNTAYRISMNGFTQMKKWHDTIGFSNAKHKKIYFALMTKNKLFK